MGKGQPPVSGSQGGVPTRHRKYNITSRHGSGASPLLDSTMLNAIRDTSSSMSAPAAGDSGRVYVVPLCGKLRHGFSLNTGVHLWKGHSYISSQLGIANYTTLLIQTLVC